MQRIYYLSTCDTCKRILKEIKPPSSYKLQDIKKEGITPAQLEEMRELEGSYEGLFNKRARLYRQRNLHQQELSENDYKNLLLEHYTFLKRPVIIVNNMIFTGNSKRTVEAAKNAIHE